MKILKAKRVFYSRQYENGMLTRDGMRVLSQAIDIALDTNQTVNDLDSLYKLFTPKVSSSLLIQKFRIWRIYSNYYF